LLGSLTKTEAAYQDLRWRILSGSLAPGISMNQEVLARDLGVSSTPVREALRRLESEGFVRFAAHSTVNVPPLSLRELDELYEVRSTLDPQAARLAASAASNEQIEAIKTMLHASSYTISNEKRFDSNREFHRAIYSASGNSELVALLEQLWDRTERYRYILIATRVDEVTSTKDHVRIVAALKHRDSDGIARLLEEHTRRSHDLTRDMLARSGHADGPR
jgi:DNA-binding GntR family transcriptional regulator